MKKKCASIKVLLLYNFNETQEIFDVKIANNHLGFAFIERKFSREEKLVVFACVESTHVLLRASLQLRRSSSFCKLGKSYFAVYTRMFHHFAWCLRFKKIPCKDNRKEKKISMLLLEYSYVVLGLFCHLKYSLMLFFKVKQCVLIWAFFFCFSSCSEHGFLLHLDKRRKL
jgi:hypothetical protein